MNRKRALVSGAFVGMALTCFTAWMVTPAAADEMTPEMKSAMFCEQENIKHYTVNGQEMDRTDAEYLYRMCCRYGIGSYYTKVICEVYQESGFNPYATNGRDYGYGQLRVEFSDDLLARTNLPADTDLKSDRFANMECMVAYIAENVRNCGGNFEKALCRYYNSGDTISDAEYAAQVIQWYSTVEEIN